MTPKSRLTLRRLHSASGVVPLGVFLCEHFWVNVRVLGGRAPFVRSALAVDRVQLSPVVEFLFILLPLAFHALYSLALLRETHPVADHYSRDKDRSWLYLLQRVTGGVVLVFLVLHLWEYRLHRMAPDALYGAMEARFSTTKWGVPWIALGYVIGLGATTSHFAAGLLGFTGTFGLAASPRARTRVAWGSGALGVLLFAMGMMTVICLATGSRFGFSMEDEVRPSSAPCGSSTK